MVQTWVLPSTNNETSLRWDLVSLAAALLLHLPLGWITLDKKNPAVPLSTTRLISVELLDPSPPIIDPIKKVLPIETPKVVMANPAALRILKILPKVQVPLNFKPREFHSLISVEALPALVIPTNPQLQKENFSMPPASIKDTSHVRPLPTVNPLNSSKEGFELSRVASVPPPAVIKSSIKNISEIPMPTVAKKSLFVISGPLKDRGIEHQVSPEYPEWAQSQGLEASLTLEFTVDPMGQVKNIIVIRRTSGYPRLDETAIQALRRWKFVPLAEDREEVGLITFKYSLT